MNPERVPDEEVAENIKDFLPSSVVCGLLGAAFLVGAALVFGYGSEILVPLVLLVLSVMLVLRRRRIRTFRAAFAFSGLAYLVALVGLYLGLVGFTPVSELGVAGHLARLLLMVGLAVAMATPAAWFARVPSAS